MNGEIQASGVTPGGSRWRIKITAGRIALFIILCDFVIVLLLGERINECMP